MSISIPDKKMDDWARDCVVRLANRVDNEKLRERLLQMAREWKPAAMNAGNRSSAVTLAPRAASTAARRNVIPPEHTSLSVG